MTTVTNTNTNTNVVPQNLISQVLKSFTAEVAAVNKARIAQDKAVQAVLDSMLSACKCSKAVFLKGNAATNPHRKEIKTLFDAIVETGAIAKATGAMYQSAFWIAFERGCAFQRDLASKAKTEAAPAAEAAPKAEKAKGTRATLDGQIKAVLATAMSLGLKGFAHDLEQLCKEALAGF